MSWYQRALRWVGASSPVEERAASKRDPKLVVGSLPLSLQLQRIAGSLTPAQVSDILRLADAGYMFKLMDLANEMRQKDCHLQSVLQTREIAIQGLDWQILPNAKGEKLKHRKQAEFVEETLRNLNGIDGTNGIVGLDGAVAHLAAGDYYGHAVLETIWAKDGGMLIPTGFKPIPARRFIYAQSDGCLRWFDATGGNDRGATTYPGVDLQADYPGRFIVYQPRITGDVSCREGLVRPLMWAALFRNWTMRDWLQLAELAWKPYRIGSYDPSVTKSDDVADFESLLQNLIASGAAILPKGASIDFEWPANGGKGTSDHKNLIDAMGNEQSKCVLGQTETTQPTKGGLGGQGSDSQHNQIRKDIRDARAKAIYSCLQRDLVAWIVRINFGGEDAPRVVPLTADAVDQVAFSTTIKNLRAPGVSLKIPAAWVRERLAIPEPDDDDELVGEGDEEDIPIDPKTGLPMVPTDPNGAPSEDDETPKAEDAA